MFRKTLYAIFLMGIFSLSHAQQSAGQQETEVLTESFGIYQPQDVQDQEGIEGGGERTVLIFILDKNENTLKAIGIEGGG